MRIRGNDKDGRIQDGQVLNLPLLCAPAEIPKIFRRLRRYVFFLLLKINVAPSGAWEMWDTLYYQRASGSCWNYQDF